MPRPQKTEPTLHRNSKSQKGRVRFPGGDECYTKSDYGTPECEAEFRLIKAKWLATGEKPNDDAPSDPVLVELFDYALCKAFRYYKGVNADMVADAAARGEVLAK